MATPQLCTIVRNESGSIIYTTRDHGITWSELCSFSQIAHDFAYGNDILVISCDDGLYSTNDTSAIASTLVKTKDMYYITELGDPPAAIPPDIQIINRDTTTKIGTFAPAKVFFANGLFIALTYGSVGPVLGIHHYQIDHWEDVYGYVPHLYIQTSTDGITWTQRFDYSGFSDNVIASINHNGSLFIFAGTGVDNITSTDGITWTLQNLASQYPLGVTYGFTSDIKYFRDAWYWLIGSGEGPGAQYIFKSADGLNWTEWLPESLIKDGWNYVLDNYQDHILIGQKDILNTTSNLGYGYASPGLQVSDGNVPSELFNNSTIMAPIDVYKFDQINGTIYISGQRNIIEPALPNPDPEGPPLDPVITLENAVVYKANVYSGTDFDWTSLGSISFLGQSIGVFNNLTPEPEPPPPLTTCWNFTAMFKGTKRFFKTNGPGNCPNELQVPGNVDLSTGVMMEHGKRVEFNRFKIL